MEDQIWEECLTDQFGTENPLAYRMQKNDEYLAVTIYFNQSQRTGSDLDLCQEIVKAVYIYYLSFLRAISQQPPQP